MANAITAAKPFEESEEARRWREKLERTAEQRPGGYSGAYAERLAEMYDRLNSRQPFRYDPARDGLYLSAREQAARLGQRAMRDTMGQAAALTGGYGSTYAQAAGQQAYDNYLLRLNEQVPELARLARQSYDADTDALYRQYEAARAADETDYARARDALADWRGDLQLYESMYSSQRDREKDLYDAALEQARWQADFDENQRQFDLTYGLNAAKAASAGRSSGSRSGGGTKAKTYDGLTDDQLRGRLQALLDRLPAAQVARVLKQGASGLTKSQAARALQLLR
ncbi:MAG: hypothetical protein IKH56_06185 [Oscillospiraceae bacterium]|nr:hypothetical protein [Oscillospiraceae bacterium]